MKIIGYIEKYQNLEVSGWVQNIDKPDESLQVEIEVEGQIVGTTIANNFRKDLLESGIGTGTYGFKALLSQKYKNLMLRDINVSVSASGQKISQISNENGSQSSDDEREVTKTFEIPVDGTSVLQVKEYDWHDGDRNNESIGELRKIKNEVHIVGSAPTIEKYEDKIRFFSGEIWALNDSIFWLSEKNIKVQNLFVTDSRFLRKRKYELPNVDFEKLVTIDTVDLSEYNYDNNEVIVLRCLGRDGFSLKFGEVYHGCSVAFPALQCAAALGYNGIHISGIVFPPPLSYKRIDGTSGLPEYVFNNQISNARIAMMALNKGNIDIHISEPESALNFL
jgi:hypothetical protein